MSARKNRSKGETSVVTADVRKNLPVEARTLIANARNDITIPYYSGAMQYVDDTLIQRGGGKGLKIYDEIERDTHAWAVLQKRKKTLLARPWEIEPASDDERDVAAADLVRACLKALPFDRITEELLDATLKGFAISEIIWGRDGNMIIPTQIISHDQRRFAFGTEWQPRLLTYANMRDGEELPERKFIVHRHGVKGNNPYGLGLGTRLFWPALFKREGIAFWLHFLDKFAGPTVVGSTPYGSVTEEQQRFLNILSSVRTSAAVAIPIGSDVKFLEAARGGTVQYQEFLAYWDKQISICVTGETLTTDIGKSGSKAASETHADIMQMLVDSDADLLSDTLRSQLLTWIVEYNLPGAKVPSIWRTRPANEKLAAEVVGVKADAATSKVEALSSILKAAALVADDGHAREFVANFGLTDELTSEAFDALIAARFAFAGSAAKPAAAPATFADRLKKKDQLTDDACCFAASDGPVERIADQLRGLTRSHFERRLKAIKAAISVTNFEEASRNMLVLAAKWTPDILARDLAEAMAVAAYEGREATFQDGDDALEFAATGVNLTFSQQVDYLRQKRATPTDWWLETLRGQHDRAFVIAGATDVAMLEEFQTALVGYAERGGTVEDFAADFDSLVEKYGWDYRGERDHRIRTIFETNMRTSFMAGRLKQMRDPDVVKLRPYWQYLHADSRIPATPRKLHTDWDGLVLLWDDPWWDTHFPPNDWLCSCGVQSLSRGDLRRLGKEGPDQAPKDAVMPVIDPATKELIMQPAGIGYGWDYMPGDRWDRGLVPPGAMADVDPTSRMMGTSVSVDAPEPIEQLISRARPFTAPLLDKGLDAETYARAFLAPFAANIDRPVLWQDAAGGQLLISDALFRDRSGTWKIEKRGREIYAGMLAEAIMDPDEIWLALKTKPRVDQPDQTYSVLSRRYIRVDPTTGLLAVFDLGRTHWEATTGFAPQRRDKPDWTYLNNQRVGRLLWKRK